MDDALSITHLSVRLGGRSILEDVTAEIAAGEFIGVFGPNGAGKSTLVRAILGLCPIRSGEIRLFGKAPGKANPTIGYMPQGRAHFQGTALSGRSLVSAVHGGMSWGLPWSSAKHSREVAEVLRLAGAEAYADRPFAVLSGGEQQRIGLAQALIGRPRMLILDEPLASLDPKSQLLLIEQIRRVRDETGTTVLFIAHDINPLLRIMDRCLYVAGGRAEIGSVDDVISNESLTRLYGADIHVVRADGCIFIVNAKGNVTETARHG